MWQLEQAVQHRLARAIQCIDFIYKYNTAGTVRRGQNTMATPGTPRGTHCMPVDFLPGLPVPVTSLTSASSASLLLLYDGISFALEP